MSHRESAAPQPDRALDAHAQYRPLADLPAPRPVLAATVTFQGHVWDVVTEQVDLGDAGRVQRDYIAHTGAVVIIALNDAGQMYLVRQYRHPVGRELWEPPAGLLDEPGESALDAAKRELWEEADLVADTWHVLMDTGTSPGGSSEVVRMYLARDVRADTDRPAHVRAGEERDMPGGWFDVAEVIDAATQGRLWNPFAIMGALAVDAARRNHWTSLRPADAPWDFVPRLTLPRQGAAGGS